MEQCLFERLISLLRNSSLLWNPKVKTCLENNTTEYYSEPINTVYPTSYPMGIGGSFHGSKVAGE
jgi:hypothetical protein